jgi:hypothetical protein
MGDSAGFCQDSGASGGLEMDQHLEVLRSGRAEAVVRAKAAAIAHARAAAAVLEETAQTAHECKVLGRRRKAAVAAARSAAAVIKAVEETAKQANTAANSTGVSAGVGITMPHSDTSILDGEKALGMPLPSMLMEMERWQLLRQRGMHISWKCGADHGRGACGNGQRRRRQRKEERHGRLPQREGISVVSRGEGVENLDPTFADGVDTLTDTVSTKASLARPSSTGGRSFGYGSDSGNNIDAVLAGYTQRHLMV